MIVKTTKEIRSFNYPSCVGEYDNWVFVDSLKEIIQLEHPEDMLGSHRIVQKLRGVLK